MRTKELLDFYCKRFAEKENWESVIADDFQFFGGDMMNQTPIVSIQGYIEIINRFFQLFHSMKVKKMIV